MREKEMNWVELAMVWAANLNVNKFSPNKKLGYCR